MENKLNESIAKDLRHKLCRLFLHCVFTDPIYIVNEITEHLDIPIANIHLRYERNVTDDNGNELYKMYTLTLYGIEFVLRYDKRLEEQRKVQVPKIVEKPKKWWQLKPDTMLVLEKVKPNGKPRTLWVLNAIDI